MTNREVIERLSQAHSATIENLYWISGSVESSNLENFFQELGDNDWKKLFPDVYKSSEFKDYMENGEIISLLMDFNKFGFIAEVHIPQSNNFTFKNKKPVSWSFSRSICAYIFVYAESMEELVDKIEKEADKSFKEDLKKELKKTLEQK